jgi:Ser/Thr protein kinase RdoA (MazF antagonist)
MNKIETALLQKVEKLYGIKNLKFVKKIRSGYLSHNFVLRSGKEKYFLKQYKYDEIERVEQIHRVQDFFMDGGIPIIHAIIAKNGKEIFIYKKKFFTLLPFVSGKIIRKKSRSKKAYASAGEMLAKIHLLSKKGFPDIIDDQVRHWTKEEFETESKKIYKIISKIRRKSVFDKLSFKLLKFKINLSKKELLSFEDFKPTHVIHGDYHGSNIFFNNNEEVSHVFDIEKAEAAPRAYEIARSMDFMCFSTHFTEKNFENARIYLKAYRSLYPISNKELVRGLKLNYLIMIYSMWLLKEHYILGSKRTDELFVSQYKSLQYYSQHFDEFIKKLLS